MIIASIDVSVLQNFIQFTLLLIILIMMLSWAVIRETLKKQLVMSHSKVIIFSAQVLCIAQVILIYFFNI